jgi:hypothetical protein
MLAWGSCGRNGRNGAWERDNFQFGKTFKYYFQCRRADIPWANCNRQGGAGQADKAGEI